MTARSFVRRTRSLVALSLGSAALMGIDACEDPPEAGIRIMPLGDSITDGYYFPGGYRIDLEDQLVEAGLDIDFVGSLVNGPPELDDQDHEGHSGWRIDQIAAEIDGWLEASQPEIVLLMIGSNDVLQDYDLGAAPDRLGALMDQIIAGMPETKLVVASITPLSTELDDAQALEYNAAIPDLVATRVAQGALLTYVDMHAALTLEDLVDGVHPNPAGYAKMADVWTEAVLELTAP